MSLIDERWGRDLKDFWFEEVRAYANTISLTSTSRGDMFVFLSYHYLIYHFYEIIEGVEPWREVYYCSVVSEEFLNCLTQIRVNYGRVQEFLHSHTQFQLVALNMDVLGTCVLVNKTSNWLSLPRELYGSAKGNLLRHCLKKTILTCCMPNFY